VLTHLEAIILGIIEGVTEFLPISSTGHLIISSNFLGLTPTEFLKTFEISIQLGAVFAVLFLYRKTLISGLEIWKKIIVGFIPTGIIGLIFYKFIKQFLGSTEIVIWSLAIGGLILIIFELLHKEKNNSLENLERITYKKSITIGFFQSIAIIPGVSRSAATILGGLLLGLHRKTIVEFSFLLAIPTIAAATGFDLLKNASTFEAGQLSVLLVGFLTSFVVAIFSIKFLLRFIEKNSFLGFGIYRLLVALVFWILIY
jgi:undecaprenyl-diphosphatase